MTEKVHVEFTVYAGKREQLLAELQKFDQSEPGMEVCQGFRADDYVQRREALIKFVNEMEIKLRKNEHKTNWRTQPIEALFRLLMLEVEEFKVADEFFTVTESRNELVDIANFALILYDRLGMIVQDHNRHRQNNAQQTDTTVPT